MTHVRIRRESPEDQGRVFEVESAAFNGRNQAVLVDALRASARPMISLVAESDGDVIGHVLLSPATIEGHPEAPPIAALGPLAVDPAHQRKGIGASLVRAALERCPEEGWRATFLVGNPAYYSRFGFVMASPLGFTYENPILAPALQVRESNPGALAGLEGRVRFHPAFSEAEPG